jgi:hypothetical protein
VKKLVLILCFNFGFQFIFSQEGNLKIETKTIVKDSINPLAPAKAAFYSAVFPGMGQLYNKKYWKLPLVYGAIGTGVYFIISNNNQYNDFRNEYKARLIGSNNASDPLYGRLSDESIIRGQKFYQRNRDLAILITAGLYLLNIVDANVDAHLMQYNVSDNLSFKPSFQTNPMSFKQDFTCSLSLKF